MIEEIAKIIPTVLSAITSVFMFGYILFRIIKGICKGIKNREFAKVETVDKKIENYYLDLNTSLDNFVNSKLSQEELEAIVENYKAKVKENVKEKYYDYCNKKIDSYILNKLLSLQAKKVEKMESEF